ncbi:MAG: tartronate semialdehyde reductase [Verrucomicrobia bacterium]|nr:tartronate semialdehyde reductase [Verrucomicrobiota bacterium]
MKIGFVGLGIMGRPMALNLIKAGHEWKVFDITPARMAGMTAAGSAREAAVGSEIGSGNVTKLANQIMVALHIAALSKAMVLAAKAVVNPENVYRAIRGGLAGSAVLDAKMPLALKGNFKTGFRIELHIKDLMNALDTAHGVGVSLPLTGSVLEFLQALKDGGHGGDDHGGLIRFYEQLAGVEVRRATI